MKPLPDRYATSPLMSWIRCKLHKKRYPLLWVIFMLRSDRSHLAGKYWLTLTNWSFIGITMNSSSEDMSAVPNSSLSGQTSRAALSKPTASSRRPECSDSWILRTHSILEKQEPKVIRWQYTEKVRNMLPWWNEKGLTRGCNE